MISMLTLYIKPTCPFCRRVMAVVDRLQLEVEIKDTENAEIKAELEALTGKTQVPYLVDTDKSVQMHESDDIVTHLQTNYGKDAAPATRPRISISDNVCVSCEG